VYITADYSPFSKRRVDALKATGATVVSEYDLLANIPRGYKVFGAYERAVRQTGIIPITPECTKLSKLPDGVVERARPMNQVPGGLAEYPGYIQGGRPAAVKILNDIKPKKIAKYGDLRDKPSSEITTKLSAYIHYGCVSLREVYQKVQVNAFRREIIYRQFFYQLYMNYQKEFDDQWVQTEGWSADETNPAFIKWCEGKTGVPAVDAGMRELNSTGYMHNRFRMITASYLIHDLGIHWSLGEKYFAVHLRDYDYTINRTNWGWVAGLKIYNRRHNTLRFNPELQLSRFDNDCTYVKKWVTELRDKTAKEILHWKASGKTYIR
jgi:deoxyribodipyrimidine photo-lyase